MAVADAVKLGDDTIVLVSRAPTGQRDRYGNDVMGNAFTEVPWCLVTPGSSSEPGDQSSARVQGLQLLAPPGTPVDAADAIIWPPTAQPDNPEEPWTGPRYEVDGDVGVWDECVQAQLSKAV